MAKGSFDDVNNAGDEVFEVDWSNEYMFVEGLEITKVWTVDGDIYVNE